VHSPSQDIPGGAHLPGVDIGYGKGATTKNPGDLLCIELVGFGFGTVDSFHVKGMTENKMNIFFGAKISEPVPSESTFGSNTDILSEWLDDFQEGFGAGPDVVVKNGFTCLVKNPDIHGPGMKIDSAVIHVLSMIESHWVSSFLF